MSSWQAAALGDIAEVFNGKTPSKEEQRGAGHPVLKIKDVNEHGEFRGTFESFVEPRFAEMFTTKQVRNGDTLVLNAAHNAEYVGSKTYQAQPPTFGALATGEWLIVRPAAEKLHPGYANHWMNSSSARRAIREMVKGIHLYPKDVARLRVPLPPLPEQRRIAEILDKADGLRAKRRAALAALDTLTQSIFLDMFGDPATNPKRWPVSQLQEVVRDGTVVTYGIVQAGDEFPGGVPYIRTGDIVDGRILSNSLRHTDPLLAGKFARSRVQAGDIVMSIRATVGTTAIVPSDLEGANLTQGTARIAPGRHVESSYLLHLLRAPGTQHWISLQIKGATFREITLARLRELPVMVPPMNVQRLFARRVGAAENLDASQHFSLSKLERLFASLQHRAFRGEL